MHPPTAYRTGQLEFRGRTFRVNEHVYLTDPELTELVDRVVQRGRELAAALGRAPVIAEFGTGCGSLAISVKAELPEATVVALEIDANAVAVARANVALHRVAIDVHQSDGFRDWPRDAGPDLIFGDPPWGDHSTVYDDGRPIEHYLAMPSTAVFPPDGSRIGCHRRILEELRARGWPCEVWLNAGTLSASDLHPLLNLADSVTLFHPNATLTHVHARFGPAPGCG